MPKGVYVRTEEQKKVLRRNFELARQRPITETQHIAVCKNAEKAREAALKLPRTQTQREASRRNARKMGLNNNMDTIVEHHKDLCHGKLKPDDVIYISASEHNRLHAKLQNQERDDKGRFVS